LGELGDTRAVEPITKYLKNEKNYIRIEAARALAKIKDERAIEALRQAQKYPDEHVRKIAKKALEESQPPH
ncbi:MAG: HEAT repeat domain-containing protein, partial [Candidatus Jordarchaeum sp.]|uniref:HEAT repeat domain-containing protein n=1 Tax=Candidatus Jordarchaeum sp. TaxID=2823881 RepID=UPI004049EDB2